MCYPQEDPAMAGTKGWIFIWALVGLAAWCAAMWVVGRFL